MNSFEEENKLLKEKFLLLSDYTKILENTYNELDSKFKDAGLIALNSENTKEDLKWALIREAWSRHKAEFSYKKTLDLLVKVDTLEKKITELNKRISKYKKFFKRIDKNINSDKIDWLDTILTDWKNLSNI